MLSLIREVFCAINRYGLRREASWLAVMTSLMLVFFGIGIYASATHFNGWQIAATGCFAVGLAFAVLLVWYANSTVYYRWQAAVLEYQQSDEPPTKMYSNDDYAV